MTVTDAVHDIAFAPNLGRSFHVLAIATKDVRIFKLVPMRSGLIFFLNFHTCTPEHLPSVSSAKMAVSAAVQTLWQHGGSLLC